MDADDICLPWRFRAQTRIIENTAVDLLFSTAIRFRYFWPMPVFLPSVPVWLDDRGTKRRLVQKNPLIHPTLFTRNENLRSLPAYPEVPAEDYALWLEAALASQKFMLSSLPTILYRLHSGQVSRGKSWIKTNDQDLHVLGLQQKFTRVWNLKGGFR